MTTIEDLTRICAGPDRKHIASPFLVQESDFVSEAEGKREMAVATDGHMFLAIDDPSGASPIDAEYSGVARACARFVSESIPSEAAETTIEKILAWTGEPQWEFPCVDCKGTGKISGAGDCEDCGGHGRVECVCPGCDDSHMRDCGACDGTGSDGPPAERECEECGGSGKAKDLVFGAEAEYLGEIDGLCIDRRRLARLASTLSGACKLWIGDERLCLRGPGWCASLMRMRASSENRFEP